VQVRLGLKEEAVTPRWRTFGPHRLGQPTAYRPHRLCLASLLLALAEERTITLTPGFSADHFDKDARR
jgi:hypothetical protein